MVKEFAQSYTFSVGAKRVIHCNFTGNLKEGASLTGTPTVVEQTTSDLTIADITITSETYTDDTNGKTVAAGKAIYFSVEGGNANTTYRVLVTVASDSSPDERIPRIVVFDWE